MSTTRNPEAPDLELPKRDACAEQGKQLLADRGDLRARAMKIPVTYMGTPLESLPPEQAAALASAREMVVDELVQKHVDGTWNDIRRTYVLDLFPSPPTTEQWERMREYLRQTWGDAVADVESDAKEPR